MKIVLVVEKSKGMSAVEQTFEKPVVRIGRDRSTCDVAFDNKDFRMVSRNHAEIRVQNGKWIVRDLGSSLGTLLNGEKVTKPTELSVGNAVQFGANGPKAHVIWLEAGGNAAAPEQAIPKSPTGTAPESPREAAQPRGPAMAGDGPAKGPEKVAREQRPRAKPPAAEIPSGTSEPSKPKGNPRLRFLDDKKPGPYEIGSNSVWLGRDPKADIVIEASAVMVSRRHARIDRTDGRVILSDNNSFNGTLLNEQRISAPAPLNHGDEIQLGPGGPVLKFEDPDAVSTIKSSPSAIGRASSGAIEPGPAVKGEVHTGTMVFDLGEISQGFSGGDSESEQLLMQVPFGESDEILVGRGSDNRIRLDGLQISKKHARLRRTTSGIVAEDLNSTNGIYLNGKRVSRGTISEGDSLQVGAFVIRIDETGNVAVFDTRSKTRIDAIGITKDVRNRAGRGMFRLLDNISLSISPNEFVGLLGPSGAGKSTLIDALNGTRPASSGSVFVNDLDLYGYLDSLKQSIGYVPQDEIIHRELTVYRTLYYVAKLRLSSDVSRNEIDRIIGEVLDVTGLEERKDVRISSLSGGQRKRVSIAVELITKPSVIFLDEPTSGLDPSTEEKIMRLFRQIAESGRTVVLTTHAMENVRLFDKIVILMRGKLVFYGKPDEALEYLRVKAYKDLYDKLEDPVERLVNEEGETNRFKITDRVADDWKKKFLSTRHYAKYIQEPLKQTDEEESSRPQKSRRLGIFGSVRQWLTLSSRYAHVLSKDRLNLLILFAQAPIIALLVFFVMGSDLPRDFAYFALSLCAIWFGTSVAAREIVRERKIYERERMVNLGVFPYVSSKLFVLGIIVTIQCALLYFPLLFANLVGLMPMPGMFLGVPQFFAMIITAGVGLALGLFVSSIVRTPEMATSLVPMILIPQIIFSGLIGVPTGINRIVGLAMPATWSFDTMKRFSTLDTLEPEGAIVKGKTRGLGLYRSVEERNKALVEDARKNIRAYEHDLETKLKDAERRANQGEKVRFTGMPDRPKVGEAADVPENLSGYITFLHPWMHPALNQFVLFFMFFMLFFWTLVILRLQDVV